MRGGYIYFIRVESGERPVKIGYSRHPTARIGSIQTWSPWPLTLVAVFECSEPEREEREIHRRLAASHLRGEWFAGAAAKREIGVLSRRLKRVEVAAKDLLDLRERHGMEVTVQLRSTPMDAWRYREAARKKGLSMSEWIRDNLNMRRDDLLARPRSQHARRSGGASS